MASSNERLRRRFLEGAVIPAHPLALNRERRFDERRQAALTRYYKAAGAGGIAVAVHTTQFAIRDPRVGLLEPVLSLAARVAREEAADSGLMLIAGICGETEQAVREATLASRLGYEAGLVSLAALPNESHEELIAHCRAVAEVIPVVGFYLQTAVGGRLLDYRFWRDFLDIEHVVAVKVAPFNRYQTLEVVRALAASGRQSEVALYTGNDDNIVADLATEHRVGTDRGLVSIRFAGGLLGQWAVSTRCAVELLRTIRCTESTGEVLAQTAAWTDVNAALFDARNGFAGCIAGLHEILRRQGLLEGRWCLDPHEDLSPGQGQEIDRVCRQYPHLQDDAFIAEHLGRWLN